MLDDDYFECYNKSEEKPVHTNIDDELQLLPKDNNLDSEQGSKIEKPKTLETIRKSKRLPFARQTEKLGGVPYQTNNNNKRTVTNRNILQEKTTTTTDQSEKDNNRTIRENNEEIRTIRHNGMNKQTFTGPLLWQDVTCRHHDLYHRFSVYRNIRA